MKQSFGNLADGRQASLFIMNNGKMEIAVTDMGAALVQVKIADIDGIVRDLVLGYDSAADYEKGTESIGGTVGRFANRLACGQVRIGDKSYELSKNNGPNTLHGGRDFYVNRLWEIASFTENSVTFSLDSPDGDQGFPGYAQITVTYTLTEDNEVKITYTACSDQDTVLNLTNHSYFNLGGHDSGSVLEQKLMIAAHRITSTDEMSLPDGGYIEVEGTPMDFLTEKEIGKDIQEEYLPLKYGNGYDHNYVLDGQGYRQVASAYCEQTGIRMNVKTDLPGMQFYTANYLNIDGCKNSVAYQPREAFCLETQYYPDAANREQFPGGILKAGEKFKSVTSYQFEV